VVRSAIAGAGLLTAALLWGPELTAGINHGFHGYRLAGEWVASHTPQDARVLDLKGWGLFYGQRSGYTFAELEAAQRDPGLGWLIAHDSLLIGPWAYCDVIRKTVGGRRPIKSFPEQKQPGVAQVHVFDLRQKVARAESTTSQHGYR
jgi:hypothetical protein